VTAAMSPSLRLPDGHTFAFSIFDDCDNSTIENTKPFYDLLCRLGMRTTKTVWALDSVDVHPNWRSSTTLENTAYRDFALSLHQDGFEIASHGASPMSSQREKIERALDVFQATFGHPPRAHANHGSNRENLYWYAQRFRSASLRTLYALVIARRRLRSEGHLPNSPYFWGDLCLRSIHYVRGFTFPVLNLRSVHPNMLYHDPATPFVRYWFSGSHAPNVLSFNELLNEGNQRALELHGGISIVATHVAAGFVQHGQVNRETVRLLEQLATRGGWFVPVSTLLDHLRGVGLGSPIGELARRAIELRWLRHAMCRGAGG